MIEEGIQAISLTYAEGRFFDLWMLPHLLAGIILGLFFISRPQKRAIVISSTLLIGWEVAEFLLHIEEALVNRVIDVLIALVGYFVIVELIESKMHKRKKWLILSGVAFIVLTILGWVAYWRRSM